MLSIAYMTGRKEPLFWWFISSLRRQPGANSHDIKIIVVDYWAQEIPHHNWTAIDVKRRMEQFKSFMPDFRFLHIPPKPTPWQGPHRLTRNDYFAAANARNTALLHARNGHIAYVDDLSVLLPTWLMAVREACANNRITAGAFKKLKDILVVNGEVKSFTGFPPGMDSRWKELDANAMTDPGPVECHPSWVFGCSFVCPIDRLLQINGWPEDADSTGIGMEDCHTGIALANNGHKIFYDRRLLTYESEDHHYQQPQMMRMDKKGADSVPVNRIPGIPDEKGHYFVNGHKDVNRFENYFGPEGIAGMRQKVLNGEPIPLIVEPKIDWHDGQPLHDL